MHNRLQQSVAIAFALLALHLIAPPVDAALNSDTGNALTVYWYESIGEHTTLDTIDWSDPDRVSNADQVNWAATLAPWEPGRRRDDLYAVPYRNRDPRAHADGLYRFRLTSDDGSRLFVDAQLVIDNDGTHSMTQVEGSVTLTGEYVPIEIFYFDRYGSAGLILEWRPAGGFIVFRGATRGVRQRQRSDPGGLVLREPRDQQLRRCRLVNPRSEYRRSGAELAKPGRQRGFSRAPRTTGSRLGHVRAWSYPSRACTDSNWEATTARACASAARRSSKPTRNRPFSTTTPTST